MFAIFAEASDKNEKPYSVLGSIDPSVVRTIVKDHDLMFKKCFKNKNKRGVLNFIIKADGKVGKMRVILTNNEKNSDAKKCIEKVLSEMRFPESDGIKEVRNLPVQ